MKHGLRSTSRKPLGASPNGRNTCTGAIHASSLERGLSEPLGIEFFVLTRIMYMARAPFCRSVCHDRAGSCGRQHMVSLLS